MGAKKRFSLNFIVPVILIIFGIDQIKQIEGGVPATFGAGHRLSIRTPYVLESIATGSGRPFPNYRRRRALEEPQETVLEEEQVKPTKEPWATVRRHFPWPYEFITYEEPIDEGYYDSDLMQYVGKRGAPTSAGEFAKRAKLRLFSPLSIFSRTIPAFYREPGNGDHRTTFFAGKGASAGSGVSLPSKQIAKEPISVGRAARHVSPTRNVVAGVPPRQPISNGDAAINDQIDLVFFEDNDVGEKSSFEGGDEPLTNHLLESSMGKRSMGIGRVGFRPGKRSMATGRPRFRPGKRSALTVGELMAILDNGGDGQEL